MTTAQVGSDPGARGCYLDSNAFLAASNIMSAIGTATFAFW